MLISSPKLGLVATTIIPFIAFVNKRYGAWLSENAELVQTALADANSCATETIMLMGTVIAFAAEATEAKKYERKINVNFRLNVRQLFIQGVYYMVSGNTAIEP